MPRTIFFFSSSTIIGGAERSLQELTLECHRRGYRCVLITPRGAPLGSWAGENGLDHADLETETLRQRNPLKALQQIRGHRRFARDLIRRYGPGIFYSNTRHAFIMLAGLPHRYPKIAHHRDALSRRINRVLYPRIDRNIFVSRFNHLRSDTPPNAKVIHNAGALDCDLPPVTPEGPLNLAMFARITPYKGHALALGASSHLTAAGISHRLDIWGSPADARDETLLVRLREKVARDGLPVNFRGFHPRPTDIMRDYHCILNPSLDEPFGRIPVEAFSLGVPVVSHASGGSLEIYEGLDDYRLYLFPDHTDKSLYQAISGLLERASTPETECARLSRIREHIRKRFNIVRLVDEVEAVFAEVAPQDRLRAQ